MTNLQHQDLAFAVLQRMGTIEEAHSAWCRMLQNNCSLFQFKALLDQRELRLTEDILKNHALADSMILSNNAALSDFLAALSQYEVTASEPNPRVKQLLCSAIDNLQQNKKLLEMIKVVEL